jgi:hypothetical protein
VRAESAQNLRPKVAFRVVVHVRVTQAVLASRWFTSQSKLEQNAHHTFPVTGFRGNARGIFDNEGFAPARTALMTIAR